MTLGDGAEPTPGTAVEQPSTLVGRVIVATGESHGVTVRVVGETRPPDGVRVDVSTTTFSDAGWAESDESRYRIEVPPGTYRVEFARRDVPTERRTVDLVAGINTLDVRLGGALAPHLPMNLVGTSFVRRFLKIFEDVHQTVSTHTDGLENLADPSVAPPRMVMSWMRCLGLERITHGRRELTLADQRRILGSVGDLINERGTRRGLLRLLTVALLTGDEIDRLADGLPAALAGGITTGASRPVTHSAASDRVDIVGDAIRVEETGRIVIHVPDGGEIAVADNGGVIGAGAARRDPDEFPMVVVDVPHSGGFTHHELIEMIRDELPADVYVAIRMPPSPGAPPEQLYLGPAVGSVADW